MQIAAKVPGLKLFAILWSIYAFGWIALEGHLLQVLLMGVGAAVLLAGHLVQRYLAGRHVTLRTWLLAMAGLGLLLGLSSSFLTLGFMALKTGLHAHGPEFSREEIEWVLAQRGIWAAAGGVGGVGLGLLTWERET